MPQRKPKTPKVEKMWMAWSEEADFAPWIWGSSEDACKGREDGWGADKYIPVRIVPEAEWQRMIAEKKGKA